MADCNDIRSEIDNVGAILRFLDSLERLHDLIHTRMEYAKRYEDGEFSKPLHEWVVLNGLLLLMKDGRVAAPFIDGTPVTEPVPGTPTIMEAKKFRKKFPGAQFQVIMANKIPMEGYKCPICKAGWDPLSFRRIRVWSSIESVPLNRYAGMTLAEAIKKIEMETEKHFFPQSILDGYNERLHISPGLMLKAGMLGQFETIKFAHPDCLGSRRS